ncbi:MAG: hypothetical protein COV46_02385 [Deltaproteobacteria bacterium CG11_big_fil_rev_8_21_14_0_20_49_13]|nr:MAG: hypothetical protein COV46_02385 [Deltaproteobacteria bacterium CG11_big_fil_rev_8_21_14_0_20_49_13]
MKIKKLVGMTAAIAMVAFFASCGGGSSSGSPTSPGDTASVKALSDIPTLDLSSYDSSNSGSANLAKLPKANIAKTFGEGMRKEGGSSRAGCEANMHKNEIFRMSQQVQLDRCYPKAMEAAGLITIPTGSYAYYQIKKPQETEEDRGKMCEGVTREEEKAKCMEGGEGPGNGGMKIRIGNIDSELQIDMCEGAEGSESLVHEATYGASGSVYTAGVVRIGAWGGHEEKGKFLVSLDLGTTGTVVDEVPTLGSDSTLGAEGWMSGGFGSGHIDFEYVGTDSSNKIIGAFGGEFSDPFTNTSSIFDGKTYAHFNKDAGCAKFSFSGKMPGMRVTNMIPYDIPTANKADFLTRLSVELGIDITAANMNDIVLCPNPLFDPESPSNTVKPMVLGEAGGSCGQMENVGVECFAISNVASTGDFSDTTYSQFFTRIASTGAAYYDEVSAYDVASISKDTGSIAFSRNWDCAGTFSEINFQNMTESQMATAETQMMKCQAIEQKARNNEGMGGYNCGEQEQSNGMDEMANDGGGAEAFGVFGGKLSLSTNDCPDPWPIPDNVFIAPANPVEKKYCLPKEGTCEEFTIPADPTGFFDVNLEWGEGLTINQMLYNDDAAPATAQINWKYNEDGPCAANYNMEQPDFQREGGGFDGEGGDDQQYMPEACKDKGLTDPAACQQLCQQPSNPCNFQGPPQ